MREGWPSQRGTWAFGPRRHQAPGAALLHPAAIASILLLAFNDHVLKRLTPGVLTGKLSDFAGMLLLPLFLHAVCEVMVARFRAPPSAALSNRLLLVCLVVAACAFALPEVWAPAEALYRHAFGLAYWPFRALAALLAGQGVPAVVPVDATADVTDLLALPMGLVAYAVGRRRVT